MFPRLFGPRSRRRRAPFPLPCRRWWPAPESRQSNVFRLRPRKASFARALSRPRGRRGRCRSRSQWSGVPRALPCLRFIFCAFSKKAVQGKAGAEPRAAAPAGAERCGALGCDAGALNAAVEPLVSARALPSRAQEWRARRSRQGRMGPGYLAPAKACLLVASPRYKKGAALFRRWFWGKHFDSGGQGV